MAWEVIDTAAGLVTRRLAVPGGWLYSVGQADEQFGTFTAVAVEFVPAPAAAVVVASGGSSLGGRP